LDTTKDSKDYRFKITTQTKIYILTAETDDIRKYWYNHLTEAVLNLKEIHLFNLLNRKFKYPILCLLQVDEYIWIGCKGDLTIPLWELNRNHKLKVVLEVQDLKVEPSVSSMVIRGNYVWAAVDTYLCIINKSTLKQEHLFDTKQPITTLCTFDRYTLAFSSDTIKVWDAKELNLIREINLAPNTIQRMISIGTNLWVGLKVDDKKSVIKIFDREFKFIKETSGHKDCDISCMAVVENKFVWTIGKECNLNIYL